MLWSDLSNRYVWVVLLVTLVFGAIGLVDEGNLIEALPEGVPPTQQERAYTSPIWYTPKG